MNQTRRCFDLLNQTIRYEVDDWNQTTHNVADDDQTQKRWRTDERVSDICNNIKAQEDSLPYSVDVRMKA
jgi:hypothetical protein